MANTIVCSNVAVGEIVLNKTIGGTAYPCSTASTGNGYLYQVSIPLPDGSVVYGLPNIPAADVATISFGIASVWALAFLIKKMMGMF